MVGGFAWFMNGLSPVVLVGIGANLATARFGPPLAACEAALAALAQGAIRIIARSAWYESAPVPASDQPWFVNGVIRIDTELGPEPLMQRLHEVERAFGRVRGAANEARVLDLDLLAYGDLVREAAPILPHPRMAGRAFVLLPLAEVAPAWRHPLTTKTIKEMLRDLPPNQPIRRLPNRLNPS